MIPQLRVIRQIPSHDPLTKWRKLLRELALAETVITSLIMLPSLIGELSVAAVFDKRIFPIESIISFFLMAAIPIISGGVGIGAFPESGGYQRRLTLAHFGLAIASALVDFVLFSFGIGQLWFLIRLVTTGDDRFRKMVALLAALSTTRALASIIHMTLSIVSSAFMCRGWCSKPDQEITVAYPSGLASTARDDTQVYVRRHSAEVHPKRFQEVKKEHRMSSSSR